ncbi:hypothetical protein DFH08DRAFT_1081873 [Mycena albidolilacea]|uniref:Uncharacterized protein n=1 Tax=Mycena albidolilacea TaxID=1033008 RepID=A0AAD7ENH0_9AGAR|nr:hypothetical protein DFH08DRAFT_1081873 [Mycena albidolilacea]
MLTVLSIGDYTSIFDWQVMVPALRTIEVLEFTAQTASKPVDLSQFSILSILRIYIATPDSNFVVLDTLSTLPSSSRISRIILYPLFLSLPIRAPALLDSTLARLPLQHPLIVEFAMGLNQYHRWVTHFPQLNSRNMLRRATLDLDWIAGYIRETDPLY